MKKALSIIICFIMLFSICFAQTFSDMPSNWSTEALTNAVKNGLINGANGLIRPDDPLTRAEMAVIITRAFGGEAMADLSDFVDVNEDDWFYAPMAKAVAMGAFTGDGTYLNPQNNISRQETFAVLARMFSLNVDAKIDNILNRGVSADVTLAPFSDADEISPWAKDLVVAAITSGYVSGSNGKINPQSNITRAEFAAVMDKLVKTYVDEPGTYSHFPKGGVLVRCMGVTINNADIQGDLIIGEGAKNGTTVSDTNVSQRYIIRTGTENSASSCCVDTVRLIRPGVILTHTDMTFNFRYAAGEGTSFRSVLSVGE